MPKNIKDPYLYIGKQALRILLRLPKIQAENQEMEFNDLTRVSFGDEALLDDDVFEAWDNIATTIYLRDGGDLRNNIPDDEQAFNEAQNRATDTVEAMRRMMYGKAKG